MKRSACACCVAASALLAACSSAHAVVAFLNTGGGRSITLQVGSANAAINTVTFDVLNAAIAPSAAPVTGVAGGGAPPTAPAGGVFVMLTTNRRGNAPDVVKLVANSSAGMRCQSGVCTASPLTIPFSTVSWTSFEVTGGGFNAGIASGRFTGSASQTLLSLTVPARAGNGVLVANTLVFSYDNATLFPSGTYSGRVTYTASVP
jgi:hypothetical protein